MNFDRADFARLDNGVPERVPGRVSEGRNSQNNAERNVVAWRLVRRLKRHGW